MKVLAYPKSGIAYNEAFYNEVEKKYIGVYDGEFSGRWILKNLHRYDCVHIHWPSFFYSGRNKAGEEFIGLVKFILFVAYIRLLGKKLFWTAHNLYPHTRSKAAWMDKVARQVVILFSCRVFVHGPTAKKMLLKEFPAVRTNICEIQHGHWIGYYPDNITQKQARRILDISEEKFVYLFFGLCARYKNIHSLLDSFSHLNRDTNMLLICGTFRDKAYKKQIETIIAARGIDNVAIYDKFIADKDIQIYMGASNVVVLPYEKSLTSGAAVLALSFGRPVIAPAMGSLVDIVKKGAGLLYDPGEKMGLARALTNIQQYTFKKSNIIQYSRSLTWNSAVSRLLK